MFLEIFAIGMIIGFVFGYFSNNWLWSRKIAAILDRLTGNDKKS